MTLKELIESLEKIQKEYGAIDCVVSIDTPDAFNETKLVDIDVNIYPAYPNVSFYKVCLKGELLPEED
jgi:hypothetical protein